MTKLHLNTHSVNLLIWEINPELRNNGKEIEFYAEERLNPFDLILGDYSEYGVSTYCIEEITSERDCEITGKKHYKAKANWSKKGLEFFSNLDYSNLPKRFTQLIPR